MPPRPILRGLPLAARLVLAAFLCAVGLGYGAAMVQVHFQDASPGQFLPVGDDLVRKFHGDPDPAKRMSTLARLLRTPEHEDVPFSGQGSMFRAFTDKSSGWKSELKSRVEADVRGEREAERDALQDWVTHGLSRADYDADHLTRPADAADRPFTKDFLNDDGAVKIKSLFTERCVRCHQPDGDDAKATKFPLAKYEQIKAYAKVDSGAMSITALAQSTHTHLLSFAVLFTLTGLVFALSSYPAWLRVPLAPLVLIAQVAEIACWWLARLDGEPGVVCAKLVMVFGGFVGLGLVVQIVLGLFDLFGTAGKAVLVLLLVGAGLGAGILKQQVIDPQLQREMSERAPATADK